MLICDLYVLNTNMALPEMVIIQAISAQSGLGIQGSLEATRPSTLGTEKVYHIKDCLFRMRRRPDPGECSVEYVISIQRIGQLIFIQFSCGLYGGVISKLKYFEPICRNAVDWIYQTRARSRWAKLPTKIILRANNRHSFAATPTHTLTLTL